MSAQEFLSNLSQVIYLVLFVVATFRFVRRPAWATFDTFLFFAVIAAILLIGDLAPILELEGSPVVATITWVGISALPLVLLRLADDFRPRPSWLMITATALFVAVSLVGVLTPQPWAPAVSLVPVAWVVVLGTYASIAFLREALVTVGVTRRRMEAVALGSGLLAVVLLLAGVRALVPGADWIAPLNQVIGLALVTSYFVGFAPPAFLRRAWQEPTLRAILTDATELVQVDDVRAVAARIEDRAAAATGADGSSLGLWDEGSGLVEFVSRTGTITRVGPGQYISGRAIEQQRVIISGNVDQDVPEHAAEYRSMGIRAVAAAPVTAGERRIGVLIVYAARPPLFTDDVVSLLSLIAEQAALVLRSQQLLREAAQVRAMAEVTRLKDDFLSVVAHDVRTPLTTILLNAELLAAAAGEDGIAARRAASLRTEAFRLKDLVEDYLDVVRSEQGRAGRRDPHDLVALVKGALQGMGVAESRVRLTTPGPMPGRFDGPRIQQLVQNLVSNAVKYSPTEAGVEVTLAIEDGTAVMTVTDRGIGIPEADLAVLFERFHRGTNADDRRYGGLGLGLYICRQVAEEHGGSIAVSSVVGLGTTFTVRLPLEPAADAMAASPESTADAAPGAGDEPLPTPEPAT